MKLTISKIDKILFSGEADSVAVPGADGDMVILSHHMPLITTLREGKLVVKGKDIPPQEFTITSGFMEVGKKETVILV
ncbi:MAG: ATP synthase epsilon chain [Parcubacteria group bacterium GW2011_GWA2_47_7]|nr:MAG: ATP synthase epsilon chain [Parcubacteria group bacterium GW2011_GWA2_47_7]